MTTESLIRPAAVVLGVALVAGGGLLQPPPTVEKAGGASDQAVTAIKKGIQKTSRAVQEGFKQTRT